MVSRITWFSRTACRWVSPNGTSLAPMEPTPTSRKRRAPAGCHPGAPRGVGVCAGRLQGVSLGPCGVSPWGPAGRRRLRGTPTGCPLLWNL